MTRTARNVLSVKAIRQNVTSHHHVCITTCIILVWHLILVVGIAAFIIQPYTWEGKEYLARRRLSTNVSKVKLSIRLFFLGTSAACIVLFVVEDILVSLPVSSSVRLSW